MLISCRINSGDTSTHRVRKTYSSSTECKTESWQDGAFHISARDGFSPLFREYPDRHAVTLPDSTHADPRRSITKTCGKRDREVNQLTPVDRAG
jgi:hypothetical protein